MSNIEVLTVYLVDAVAGHDKYYRTFAGNAGLVIQYGPNTTAGYGNLTWRPDSEAVRNAREMIHKKEAKGYNNRTTFTFDWTGDMHLRAGMEDLVDRYETSKAAAFVAMTSPVAAATPVETAGSGEVPADRFAEFTARALAAISLSVTDRDRAAVELSLLNARWEELEQVHGKAKSYMNTLHQMMTGGRA